MRSLPLALEADRQKDNNFFLVVWINLAEVQV